MMAKERCIFGIRALSFGLPGLLNASLAGLLFRFKGTLSWPVLIGGCIVALALGMLSEKGLDLFWNRVLGNGRRTVITRVPGSRLRVILDWVYSERAMQGVFGPALADMQDEWFQAIVDGKKLKACWVRIRGYYSVYSAVGLHVAVSAGRKLLTAWNMGK